VCGHTDYGWLYGCLERTGPAIIIFSGSYAADTFGAYAKLIIALTAGASLLLSVDYLAEKKLEKPEFPVLALLATLGMFIMVSAHDLIALYIGVEMQSLALYVLAAYARDDAKSSEAGLKYFVLGALSSGLLLYGCSLVYGFTGSVKFDVIAQQVEANRSIGVVFGMVFVLCGLGFKMSAAPFHMCTKARLRFRRLSLHPPQRSQRRFCSLVFALKPLGH
jgi:NADH-quinone oxidoreductase subunit N